MKQSMLRPHQHNFPSIGESTYLDPSCVIIGDVTLGKNCSVWPLVVMRGDVNHIRIGDRSNIQDGSVLHVTHKNQDEPNGYPVVIGCDVTIGHKVILHGCSIGDRVLVGMGSTILDGAVIESDVMVGAASLVAPNKRLQSGFLYIGSPAKAVRPLTEQERAFLLKSADNYVRLKESYQ
ncbi:MAG: gamma carbonic anhydrase family protein [Vibrionaceae bacterium]